MQSNQPTVEEVTSDNIVEKEIEPPKTPKRKKKKVSFAVWWELHATEEQKMSAENIEQQDASLAIKNESIAKGLEKVDQKGDSQPPEIESNEKNQVPFKTWSEEHVPIDQEISAGKIENQNDSLISEEESIAGVQETINIAEKEQPSKSKEQPPKTRRKKVKMIPFQIWLEKHAPADLRISDENTGMEDVSLDTKQESISVQNETPEKEQPFKSGAENVKKQDTFLLEKEGDQEDSLEKEIFKEEPAISTTELVTEKKSISRSQEKVDQKGDSQPPEIESNEKNQVPFKTWSEEQVPIDQEISAGKIEKQNDSLISEEESIAGVQETINIAEKEQPSNSKEQPPTTRSKKNKMIPFQIWLEKHAPADLRISDEISGMEDVSLDTKQESISVQKETPEKEQPFKSGAENVKKQDTFLLEKVGDQEDSLEKEICKEEPANSTTELVTEKKSISSSQEKVDQKGDSQPPEIESNEKNQVPFKTWSEEHVPIDQEISAGNIEKQNDSLISEEESIAGVQETINIAEKEQPSKSKEQPPKTRRKKNKMIPFQIWLEKHAPADLRISDEISGIEDVTLDTKQESISVQKETPEKEQPFKSGAENVKKQDTFLLEKVGDQEDSLKKEICKEEPAISTTELVTEKKSISRSQEKVDQKGEKQTTKTKRIKKTPLLWKSFPESDACIDLTFFTENSDINNGPLPEKQNYQAALPVSGKKTIWKMLPNSEPRIDISFIAENIETQNVSVPEQERDEAASLAKESFSNNNVISTTQLSTKKDEKGEKCTSTGKPKDNNQTENLTKVPDNHTAENVEEESLTEIQNLPHSSEKTKSQAKCTCLAKSKESELEYIEVQKYLMQQLDEMFNINQKLNAKLKQQKDLMRKGLAEKRQRKNSMVSVQIQTDSQDSPKQKTVSYQSASIQTEMDIQETSFPLKPVHQTTSTQTEMDGLETRCQLKPVYQSISTQTEFFLLQRQQPSETKLNGHQDPQIKLLKRSTGKNRTESTMKAASELETLSNEKVSGEKSEQDISVPEVNGDQANETVIAKPQEEIEEETVSTTQLNGDHEDQKKQLKTSKRKNKRKATMKAACELETFNNEQVSGENIEQELSVLEIVGDQTATIINEIHENETIIGKLQEEIEDKTVSITQLNGDHEDQKKQLKTSKRKNKRKATKRAVPELENLNNDHVSEDNIEQEEVSIAEIVGDQTATMINENHAKETVIGKLQEEIEEETVSTTQLNKDQQDEKKPLRKSKRKNKKAAMKAACELENLNNENVSGKHIEQELSVPEIVGDQTATIINENHAKETVIGNLQEKIKEETVSITQLNKDHQDEKKQLRKSKRKNKKKAAMKAACELETLNNENVSGKNSEHPVVSILETVGDQTASIKNEINTEETVIAKVQKITEEETASETHQTGDQQDEKQPSRKSKYKIRRRAAMKAASELENLINEKSLVENTQQEEVSMPEIVGDQTATIIIEIHKNEAVIGKLQQITEETTQQNGDQPEEKKPLTKSKCKEKRNMAMKPELETVVNLIETDQNFTQNTKTPKADLEIIPEIPQTAFEPKEIKPCKVSEDVRGKVPVVSTEGESGLMEKQRTSPPQINVTLNKDLIQTTSEESKTQAAEESADQTNISVQEENTIKKIPLWKRFIKALSPTSLRKFKDRCKVHPA